MSSTLPDQSPAASPPEPLEPQAASPAEAMPDPPLEAAADLAPAPVQPVRAMPWQSSGRNIWTISSSAWPVLVLSGLVVLLLTLTWLLPQLLHTSVATPFNMLPLTACYNFVQN